MNDQTPYKLSPDMVSRPLIVLRFIRDYISEWGQSPSRGEIANGCDITRSAARNAIRSLEAKGMIIRTGGERGLRLPSEKEGAVRTLKALGWEVFEGEEAAAPPDQGPISPLPGPIVLDYPGSAGSGDGNAKGEQGGGKGA